MTIAIAVVLAILVGLPLLAWWVGNRRFWSRLRSGAEADPWRDAMRRFGLTPAEAAQVESAVTWGRRLDEERLRPAAVQWARYLLEQAESRRRIRSGWGRAAVLLCWFAVLVIGLWWASGGWGEFPWGTIVWWVIWPATLGWMVWAPRRAIRVNADPVSPTDAEPGR